MAYQPQELSSLKPNRSKMPEANSLEAAIDAHIASLVDGGKLVASEGFVFPLEGRWDVSPLILRELRSRFVGWAVYFVDRREFRFVPVRAC